MSQGKMNLNQEEKFWCFSDSAS